MSVETDFDTGDTTTASVRIASFIHCDCDFSPEQHVKISVRHSILSDIKAVAISYAWGALSRETFSVGHYAPNSKPVFMTLGGEWSKANFLNRLCELTHEHGGCWIDQLCVPQKDEEISAVLATIPTIFRTLPVIAVFPGSLCRCLRPTLEEWKSSLLHRQEVQAMKKDESTMSKFKRILRKKETVSETLDAADARVSQADQLLLVAAIGVGCLASNGCCSWIDRVWTSQEYRFATQFSIIFADETPAQCLSVYASEEEFAEYPGYLGDRYRQLRSQGISHEAAEYRLRRQNTAFAKKLYGFRTAAQAQLNLVDIPNEAYPIVVNVSMLLTGTPVNFVDPDYTDPKRNMPARYISVTSNRLRTACTRLTEHALTATQQKDYILSVWSDETYYKIPDFAKNASAFELLADALSQLRANSRTVSGQEVWFGNTWAAGLFGASVGTAFWSFECYMPRCGIRDSRDVYGGFAWGSIYQYDDDSLPDLAVPIKIRTEVTGPKISPFDRIIEDVSKEDTFKMANLMARYMESREEGGENDNEEIPPLVSNSDDPVRGLFEYVCELLGLDPEFCREQGITLMMASRELESPIEEDADILRDTVIPCVGLVNEARLREIEGDDKTTYTVTMEGEEIPYYEIMQLDEEENRFIVIGIWAPLDSRAKCIGLGAVISTDDWNAFIV